MKIGLGIVKKGISGIKTALRLSKNNTSTEITNEKVLKEIEGAVKKFQRVEGPVYDRSSRLKSLNKDTIQIENNSK